MKTITATEANRNFARILDETRRGVSYLVTSHGTPVAKVVPVRNEIKSAEPDIAKQRLFDRLNSQPALNLGPWTRDELYDRD